MKYNALLDGLEAVEVKLSAVLEDNDSFRFDSEYFKKSYLNNISKLQKKPFLTLEKYIDFMSGGATPLGADYLSKGIPFLRVQNIMQNYFKLDDIVYISKKQDSEIKRSKLKEKDVLLTITGISYGKSATVTREIEGSNINQHSVKIALKKHLNPYFLSTFLNSFFGKSQSDKNIVGVTRPALDYKSIRKFIIPIPSTQFQSKIETLVKSSYQKLEQSKILYKKAEELLLKELDLLDFEPSKEKVAVKTFSESFGNSGRLDSEYYQPRYDEIIAKIKTAKFDKLNNLVDIKKSIEPGSEAYQDSGIPFVRVSNLTKFGLSSPDIHLSKTLFDDELLEKLQPKKDTILLSKDGTVGIAYNIKKDTNIITSGAMLHLTIIDDNVLPEYLTLVLNSLLVQMQSQRDAGGSIIKHWKPSEIEEILIPIINQQTQNQIEDKIKESFALKEQSKQLLETAKRAVEIAIEENENSSMEYIEKEIPNTTIKKEVYK